MHHKLRSQCLEELRNNRIKPYMMHLLLKYESVRKIFKPNNSETEKS